MGTPSISQALSGIQSRIEEPSNIVTHNYEKVHELEDKSFSKEDLISIWPAFIEKYKDQTHIYNTLLSNPDLQENHIVVISVEN